MLIMKLSVVWLLRLDFFNTHPPNDQRTKAIAKIYDGFCSLSKLKILVNVIAGNNRRLPYLQLTR